VGPREGPRVGTRSHTRVGPREGSIMILIYRRKPSEGAKKLAAEIRALGLKAKASRKPQKADLVVCWGFRYTNGAALNGRVLGNKFKELEKLKAAKIRVPEVSLEPKESFVGRLKHHTGGHDLVTPPETPDFYVKRLTFVQEFRVHIFKGASIRLGIKVPSEGAHAWVRTHEYGWRFDYGGNAQSSYVKGVRQAAKKAIAALGYDFGAVDVAVTPKGRVYVLEVNSAPGLDNENTAKAYARHIVNALG
jgi:hypothetical protein